jgi:hypothetical protein
MWRIHCVSQKGKSMKRITCLLVVVICAVCALPSAALADPPRTGSKNGSVPATTFSLWSTSHTSAAFPGFNVHTQAYGPPVPQIWGWCGIITKEKKVIRRFKKKGGAKVVLFCGGPKYDSAPKWGLRHIERRHRGDWDRKAFGTSMTWRQLADIGIAATLADPYVRGKVKDGKHCYSRVIYLWDLRRYRIVGTTIVRVLWRADGDRRIITAYPSDTHCDVR